MGSISCCFNVHVCIIKHSLYLAISCQTTSNAHALYCCLCLNQFCKTQMHKLCLYISYKISCHHDGIINSNSNFQTLKLLVLTMNVILSCNQAFYEWFSPSVCLSICPSVCHTFLTLFPSSYHHEIFRTYYQWQKWCPCKRSRSKVKVTVVNTQLCRFRTVTPVWFHIWWCNDASILMLLRRGALLFFKVIREISRSHG